MRPTKLDGSTWNPIDSNAMLQSIRRTVIDELNARDVARGLPKSLACGKWVNRNGTPTFVVDPRLSALKHSGEEASTEWVKRWQAFCSAPRDPLTELAKIGETPAPDETPRTHVQGLAPSIQEAIAEGIKAGVAAALSNGRGLASDNVLSPPIRHAGRPRKLEPADAEATT
jgi:hypothetical protein